MLIDLLILAYIMLLFPLIFECEKLPQGGFKVLLVGILFTPLVGFAYLFYKKKKAASSSNQPSHA
ncbi:MAG TPA: hypothetical protein VJ939_02095 [Bacteroidales bacterium]|nr:hypothetical protein [Bacteroidales bacterium]